MIKKGLCLLLVLLPFSSRLQLLFDYQDSIPVFIGAKQQLYPWSGGLNYPQFSEIDYDYDGDMDLFLFDRSHDNIRLFEKVFNGTAFSYEAIYNPAYLFPDDLEYRVFLADYNQDGKVDLFTHAFSGLKVYRNVGNASTGLQWQLAEDLVYSTDNLGLRQNLFISSNDVPAIADVEGDGDLDVLTFNIGGERVEYHQNQSQELYGHSDSLVFELKNECWGKFKEDGSSSAILLNDATSPCSGSVIVNPEYPQYEDSLAIPLSIEQDVKRHTGSTLLALDYDNSGVMDLLLGDVSSLHMTLLLNGGTAPNTNSAMNQKDSLFPSTDQPIDLSFFPAAYYLDVDHDTKKDLIVAPNARNASENRIGVLYYKNTGTASLPDFSFQTKSFLQEEMIDAGTGAIPVLVDENGDGKKDLFVANFFRFKDPADKESVIANYRNTGTLTQPKLNWVADDYFGLAGQNLGLRTVPAFGDLNGDSDQDLILGLENGTLMYFENTSGTSTSFQFSVFEANYSDVNGTIISVGAYSFPQLFDLNKDDLLDLLIGNKNGEIAYYQNTGTANVPQFTLIEDTLGGIDLSPDNSGGYATPHFFRFQDTTRLLLGNFDGTLHYYDSIDNNLTSPFRMVSDKFRQINVEAYSSCWVDDIDGDGKLNLFVGGDLGGIYHYEHNPNSTLAVKQVKPELPFRIYPNPSDGKFNLDMPDAGEYRITVISAYGQELFNLTPGETKLDLSELADGIYLLNVQSLQTGLPYLYRIVKASR